MRSALQDLLWSDRDQAHGRDSLKKALRELRDCLNREGEVLLLSGGAVSLDMGTVWTDLFDAGGGREQVGPQQFLAGLHIHDPQFEDWLRLTRQQLEDREPCPDPMARPPWDRPARFTIRFAMPPEGTVTPEERSAAECFGIAIQGALLEQDFFAVAGPGSLAHMEVQLRCIGKGSDELRLDLVALALGSGEVLWRGGLVGSRDEIAGMRGFGAASSIAHQIADRAFVLAGRPGLPDIRAADLMRQGIDQMFRVGSANLAAAESAFERAVALDPRPSYLAWQAHLYAFKHEKRLSAGGPDPNWERAEELARKALEADRYNPLVCGLVAHLYGFARRDFRRAHAVFEPIEGQRPDSLILQDALALFRFYTGDLGAAERHAAAAARLGAQSPYRYLFTTTSAMIALVKGDFAGAERLAERALAQHPIGCPAQFEPTLRTLIAARAHGGERKRAAEALARLRAQAPNFSIRRFECPQSSPIPNPEAFRLIKSGLEIANAE
ncbi:hypothetical protein [Rhodovulum strictum]|nr:hypothetical protein [Rhodovulum strictum]